MKINKCKKCNKKPIKKHEVIYDETVNGTDYHLEYGLLCKTCWEKVQISHSILGVDHAREFHNNIESIEKSAIDSVITTWNMKNKREKDYTPHENK